MSKCTQCKGAMRATEKYEHVSNVAGVLVRDASGKAPVCRECGSAVLSLEQVERYERRAAAIVLRTRPATGALLRYARRALGLKQADLAALLECAAETVSRWETGATPIPRSQQLAMIALLDTAFFEPTVIVLVDGELVVPTCAA